MIWRICLVSRWVHDCLGVCEHSHSLCACAHHHNRGFLVRVLNALFWFDRDHCWKSHKHYH
jgi:hypothetical protein